MYAVGYDGQVAHWDGLSWSLIDLGLTFTFMSVWGSGPADVYVGAPSGLLLHWDGSSWAFFDSGSPDSIRSLWGTGSDDVFIGGANGMVQHLGHPLPALKGGSCARPIPIYCESSITSANYGKPSVFASYPSCSGGRAGTGGEMFYRLHNAVTGQVQINLTPVSGDLDLVVVRADGSGACDTSQCLGASATGAAVEQVTIPNALTDDVYYIIVDGFAGAESGYTLDVQCTRQ